MDLSKKIFGANVDKTVREYFESLQEGTFEIQPGQSISPKRIGLGKTSVGESYLGDRTSYARMWVAVNGYEVKKVEGKYQRINDGKVNIYSVNENLSDSYSELDATQKALLSIQTYQPQLQSNPYLKPPAGIESIDSKSEGAVGALRRTTVNFIVHNKQDFENIFLPFFLKPGATVFVDFGWSDKAFTLYNPNDKVTNKNLDMASFYESIYPNNDDIKKGFTTTVSGQVTKYDVNIDQNGSFKCSLEFVSSNYSLLDKSISDDNNLKFIFENSIEELLMGYFLNFSGVQIDTEILISNSSKLTAQERSKLVKDFFDDEEKVQSDLDQTIGIIDSTSKLSGIFYQNLIKGNAEEDKLSEKESLYISYGLFEDKFLNQFISYWVYYDDDGEEVGRAEEKKNPFSNSFSSFNSWARYSEDLLLLQKQRYDEGDSIISFLYPDTWDEGETYNKVKPVDWDKEKGTETDKQKSRIPLRDLFISVPLISEAFRKSQNVNDALEFIFDKIYEDSGNIINIKMTTNNEAMTSLTFTDVYVANELFDNDDILTFDTTSGNTIVLNSDLKFETPKAGLSSMIAIGNLSEPSFFDEQELQNFNFLNSISSPAEKSNRQKKGMKYQVKHLPDFGEPPKSYKSLTLNMKKFMETEFIGPKKSNDDVSEDYNTYLEERQKLIDEVEESGEESENNTSDVGREEQELETETVDGRQIFYAKSSRDFRMLHAKVNSFINTTDNTISPVLPVSLTLKVYGNNFLGIGDFFTINFLPKHYQDRVYFQIVGVDHNVGTSMWETTYTTVMRLKSNEKSRTHGQIDEKLPEIRLHPLFQKQKAESMIGEISSKENLAGKYCVKNYKKEETSRITLTKLPVGLTRDDIPNLLWEKESFVWDAKNDEEKRKKEGNSNNNNSEKLMNTVKLYDNMGSGELAYFITISNLILGDELINWELLQSKGLPYELRESDGQQELNRQSKIVYVTERSDSALRAIAGSGLSNFRDFILEKFDQPGVSLGLDDFQEKLYEQLGFLKQEVSSFLIPSKDFTDNLYLNGLTWDVSAESPLYQNDGINSEKTGIPFIRFTVTEHSDTRVIPSIVVPRELLKIQSVDVLGKKVWREYCGLKAGFKELFESDERELQ